MIMRLLVLGTLLFAQLPVLAETTLEEIIVTAQKREQSLNEVPISLSVLPGTYIERRDFNSLEEVTANQPSVTISRNSNASKIYMRGIGSQGNEGLDQSVSVFIDDVYHGRSRNSKSALVDIERIEILKGPQSTYFGLNSSAGAIAVQTRKADIASTDGYARASVGTDGAQGARLAYNMPLGERFALRAVMDWSTLDGYWDMVDPATGDARGIGGGRDSGLARLSARWRPGERFQADFKIESQDIERDNPYAWQPGRCGNLYGLGLSSHADLDQFWAGTGSAQPSPLSVPVTCEATFADKLFDSRSPAAPFNTSDFEATEALARLAWDFGSVEVVSTTAYFDMDFAFAGNDLTHGAPGNRPLWLEDGSSQASQELRLNSLSTGSLAWLVGVYRQSGDVAFQTGNADARNPMNPQFVRTEAHQDDRTASAFGSLDWNFNDRWTAGVGLRWTETRKTFSGVDERILTNTVAPPDQAAFRAQVLADTGGDPNAYVSYGRQIRGQFDSESRTFDDTSPSFRLLYQAREDLLAYYTWTTGGKAGGFNFRLNGLDQSTLTYEAESVEAHEIGIKGLFLQGRMRLGAAIFVSDYEGLQQNSNRGDGGVISAAVIRNAAKASSDGIELELAWQISDSFRTDLSAAWLDAKFDSYQGADCTRFQSVVSTTDVASLFGAERNGNRCSQDLSGGKLAHAPDFAGRLGFSHQFVAAGGWTVNSGIEWFYSDEFFTSPHADRLRMQPAFSKINARIAFGDRTGRWNIAVIANNVTDELTARQLGQDQDAAVSGLIDDPRRVVLEFLYSF